MPIHSRHKSAYALLVAIAVFVTAAVAEEDKPMTQKPTGQYADVNGLKMYYEVHGKPHKGTVPLVLVHGGGSTIQTSWGTTLPQLAKTRQVIAFEQQGHGHTNDIVDRPFTFEQSADDAAELLHRLKVPKADFCGYSNGGSIVMQVAIRHPELVNKLVIISAMYRRDGLSPQLLEGLKHATPDNMPPELRAAYLATSPNPELLALYIKKSVKRMLEFQDWSDDTMRGITAPSLVLIGDKDVIVPEHAVAMYHLLPHGELAIFPNTDHMQIVERGEKLLATILPFLDEPAENASRG